MTSQRKIESQAVKCSCRHCIGWDEGGFRAGYYCGGAAHRYLLLKHKQSEYIIITRCVYVWITELRKACECEGLIGWDGEMWILYEKTDIGVLQAPSNTI